MKKESPPGVFDIVPFSEKDSWRESHLWTYVEEVIRETARQFGYQEIRTPIFERTELFVRGVGESSDIVSKEMYTFEDKGGRSLSLRPEGTAPVLRAFVENHMQQQGSQHKLFYIGPQFRHERQQAGRYRQHHQFGAEAIGISSVEQDVELIALLYTLYQKLGLEHLKITINTLGSKECRASFRKALKEYLAPHLKELSPDSQKRLEQNPLRILDSKNAEDQKLLENAPSIHDYLDPESKREFEKACKLLESLDIPYEVNPLLVRGLDYYNHIVFEVLSNVLGAQNSIGGGGRYDGLLEELGGPALPACGFGTGMERIIQTMLGQEVDLPERFRPTIYLIPIGDKARSFSFSYLQMLRNRGISALMDYSGKKLGKVMQIADSIQAKYVVVLGENELEAGKVELKEMDSGTKTQISLTHLEKILEWEEKEQLLTKVWDEMSQPFDEELSNYFMQKMQNSIDRTAEATKRIAEKLEEMKPFLESE